MAFANESYLAHIAKGVAIGLANIIPGVSGGTMALLLGIYERLIAAVRSINAQTPLCLFRGLGAIRAEAKRIDAHFLAAIALGAGLAILSTSKFLVLLLQTQHDPTYGFFFGLVLLSLVVPYREIRRKSLRLMPVFLLGVFSVLALVFSLSNERQIESAKQKAALRAAKSPSAIPSRTPAADRDKTNTGPTTGKRDPRRLLLFCIAGAIAMSAMILPGISGSFILLLMGVYFDILLAINERQLIPLAAFMIGCILGLMTITRMMNLLLRRYHDGTMAYLLGLVLGSLVAIWPFRAYTAVAGKRVDLERVIPAHWGLNEFITLAMIALGAGIVGIFLIYETRVGRRQITSERS